MRRWLVHALILIAAIAMSATGSFAAPFSGAGAALSSFNARAMTKVQTACGWTYACTDVGSGAGRPQNIQIYGPVNVFPNAGAETKEVEVWKVPEGAWPWTGQGGQAGEGWRGWSCDGHPCDEKCGAFCWFNRIRSGYCGHGCDAYREHVMFQPVKGNLKPFIYRNPPDGYYGYGSPDGYFGNRRGPGPYGYGYGREGYEGGGYERGRYEDRRYGRGGYSRTSIEAGGYPPPNARGGAYGNAPAPAPGGERFIDRLRRYFTGGQAPSEEGPHGAVRFERPSNELVPLRRFSGPKYPPACTGKNCQ